MFCPESSENDHCSPLRNVLRLLQTFCRALTRRHFPGLKLPTNPSQNSSLDDFGV